MPTYVFRPAPLRPKARWVLGDGRLGREGGASIALADIVGGHYSDLPAGRYMSSYFDLAAPAMKLTIACNDYPSGTDRAQYLALVSAALEELGRSNPRVLLSLGAAKGMRVALAAIGVGIVITAAAMTIGPCSPTEASGSSMLCRFL